MTLVNSGSGLIRSKNESRAKRRIAGEAFFDGHAQPLQGFPTLGPQRVGAGDVVSGVMPPTASSLLFQNRSDRCFMLLVFLLQGQ
jgi:hypothetical protein